MNLIGWDAGKDRINTYACVFARATKWIEDINKELLEMLKYMAVD